jgi:ABC-type spermidine/putrescine transport system permease subunit II
MTVFEDLITYLRDHAPEILARVGVALLIAAGSYVVARLLARFAATLVARRKQRGHRAKTLEPIIRSIVFLFAFGAGLVSALDQLRIRIKRAFDAAEISYGAPVTPKPADPKNAPPLSPAPAGAKR